MKAGAISQGITFELQAVADQSGFFRKQGLNVKRITTQSGVTATKAVAAGQLDVAVAGGSEVINAAAKGANVKIIAADVRTFPYYLIGRKGIKSPVQLKGGSVAVSHVGASSYYGAVLALSKLGLEKKDYKVRLVGGQSARYAAVASGAVDASVNGPYLLGKAKSAGLNILADLAKEKILYAEDYVVANGSFIHEHPEFVTKYRTALKQARHFLFDPANEEEVEHDIHSVIKGGPQLAKLAYEYVQEHKKDNLIFPKGLSLSKRVFRHTLSVTGGDATLKLSDLVASGVPVTD